MERVDDDAGQARGVEQAFVEVEIPGPGLLGEQSALQAVGQPGDHALKVGKLLVQHLAQPGQFVRVAELLRLDDLVEFIGIEAIGIDISAVAQVMGIRWSARTARLVFLGAAHHFRIGVEGLFLAAVAVAVLAFLAFQGLAAFAGFLLAPLAFALAVLLFGAFTLLVGVLVGGVLLGAQVQVQVASAALVPSDVVRSLGHLVSDRQSDRLGGGEFQRNPAARDVFARPLAFQHARFDERDSAENHVEISQVQLADPLVTTAHFQ